MKRHLKRFGWLYLTLLAAIAYPAIIVYMQFPPRFDIPTLRRVDHLIQEGFIRSHPNEQIKHLSAGNSFDFPAPPDYKQFIITSLAAQAPDLAAMPAARPELDRVTSLCKPEFGKLDSINAQNICYFPANADSTTTQSLPSPTDLPNFLNIQILSKIRKAQAEAAIYDHRWEDALRLLESAARISDSSRFSCIIGTLVSIASRGIAYSGYDDLLLANPPPEVVKAALKTLVALRQTEPAVDNWAWLAEREFAIGRVIQSESKDSKQHEKVKAIKSQISHIYPMLAFINNFVESSDRIKNPQLKAWAEEFAHNQKPRWTIMPSAYHWLNEMIRKEPWVYRNSVIPEGEYAKLDKWSLLMVNMSLTNQNMEEMQTRSRILSTRRRLTEAAFGARLYQDKYGAAPTEFKQLAEFCPLPSNDASTGATSSTQSTGAFLPIRIGEREMTPELIGKLQQSIFAMGNWLCFHDFKRSIHADGSFAFADSRQNASEWFDEPVRALAIEQLLKSHPRLVESAQLEVTTVSVPVKDVRLTLYGLNAQPGQPMMPGMMPVQPGMMPGVPAMMGNGAASNQYGRRPASPISFQPLDPALARQITENTYRLKAIAAAKEAGYSSGHGVSGASGGSPAVTSPIVPPIADATTITQPSIIRIDQMRLTGKFRIPEKATLIWSPGPDGKDDNAQIVYDATNGTVSSGDIVLFPENY